MGSKPYLEVESERNCMSNEMILIESELESA